MSVRSRDQLYEESETMKVLGLVAGIVCVLLFLAAIFFSFFTLLFSHILPAIHIPGISWLASLTLWGMPFYAFCWVCFFFILAIAGVIHILQWLENR